MHREFQEFIAELRGELLKTRAFLEHRYRFAEKEGMNPGCEKLSIESEQVEGVTQICSIKTETLYQMYENDMDVSSVVSKILKELDLMDRSNIPYVMSKIHDYKSIRGRLFVRLLNYENNKDALDNAVYRRTGDIAQVLYIKAGEEENSLTSAKVQKDLLKVWNKDETEVFEKALLNTCFLMPPRVYKWEKMLTDISYEGENFMNLESPVALNRGPAGNCISTVKKTNGAVAVFFPGVLPRISDLLSSDLYLAFTSIHEVMVHAVSSVDPEQIRDVLTSTIEDCTPEHEFLTDNIYYYSRSEGQLVCL